MQNNEIKISQITTDHHVQIKKCMRENHKNVNHQFNIWHVCENLEKKLTQSAKKKSCSIIDGQIKSICNHFWWCCGSCDGNEQLLREK